jgi:hypothetical protein
LVGVLPLAICKRVAGKRLTWIIIVLVVAFSKELGLNSSSSGMDFLYTSTAQQPKTTLPTGKMTTEYCNSRQGLFF